MQRNFSNIFRGAFNMCKTLYLPSLKISTCVIIYSNKNVITAQRVLNSHQIASEKIGHLYFEY